MSRAEVIFELLDEIRVMEDTVLYFNNRILEKRITIAELMRGLEAREEGNGEPLEPLKLPRDAFSGARRRWGAERGMIDWTSFLTGKNGEPFNRREVVDFACSNGLEGITAKQRAATVVCAWLKKGYIRRVDSQNFVKISA